MTTQVTLAGDEADDGRTRPSTLIYCVECGEHILRSSRFDHPDDHTLAIDVEADDEDDEDEPEPERVGGLYEIRLHFSTEYSFRVPAWSEHEAEDHAELLACDYKPADRFLVHSERREIREIMSDDDRLPDDWDPYGGTPLYEVYGKRQDDDEDEDAGGDEDDD